MSIGQHDTMLTFACDLLGAWLITN